MAEQIKVPFGTVTRVDPRNHVLDGGPNPQGKAIFLGKVATRCKQRLSQQRIGMMREVASANCRLAAHA